MSGQLTVSLVDTTNNAVNVYPDGSIPVTNIPEGAIFFGYSINDVPGVIAANNFISQFNPVGSGKTMVGYLLSVTSYSTAAVSIATSMIAQRISAASVGTLVTASTINKFNPTQADSIAEIRTGNPTVTRTGLPLIGFPPIISTGAGAPASTSISPPNGASFISPPGTGVVIGTSAGAVNQIWGINLIWAEI